MNGVQPQPRQLHITDAAVKDLLEGTKQSKFAQKVDQDFQWTTAEKFAFAGVCFGTGGVFLLVYGAVELLSKLFGSAKPEAEIKRDIVAGYISLKDALYDNLSALHERGKLDSVPEVSSDFMFGGQAYTFILERNDKEGSLAWTLKRWVNNSEILYSGTIPSEKNFIDVLHAMNPLNEPFADSRRWYLGVGFSVGLLAPQRPATQLIKDLTEDRALLEAKIELIYDEGALLPSQAREIAYNRDFVSGITAFDNQQHRDSYDSFDFGRGSLSESNDSLKDDLPENDLPKAQDLQDDNFLSKLYKKNPIKAEKIKQSIDARMDGFKGEFVDENELNAHPVSLLQSTTMTVERDNAEIIAHPHVLSLVAPKFKFANSGKDNLQQGVQQREEEEGTYSEGETSFAQHNIDLGTFNRTQDLEFDEDEIVLNESIEGSMRGPDENEIAYQTFGNNIVKAAIKSDAKRVVLSVAGMDAVSLDKLGNNKENAKNIAANAFVDTVRMIRQSGRQVVYCDDYGLDYESQRHPVTKNSEFWGLVNEKLRNANKLPIIPVQSGAIPGKGWVKNTDLLINNTDPFSLPSSASNDSNERSLASRTTMHFGAAMAARNQKRYLQEEDSLQKYQLQSQQYFVSKIISEKKEFI